jgi:hypothetical protein
MSMMSVPLRQNSPGPSVHKFPLLKVALKRRPDSEKFLQDRICGIPMDCRIKLQNLSLPLYQNVNFSEIFGRVIDAPPPPSSSVVSVTLSALQESIDSKELKRS